MKTTDAIPTDVLTKLRSACAPVMTGWEGLPLASAALAVKLAAKLRAKAVFLHAWPVTDRMGVRWEASEAFAQSAKLQLHVTCTSTLDDVLALRQAIASADPSSNDILAAGSAVVRIDAGVDPRIIEQWHRLAEQVQLQTRMAVLEENDRKNAVDAMLWHTGVSPASGGLDFAHTPPRPCPPLPTLLDRKAVDLLVALQPSRTSHDLPVVHLHGEEALGQAMEALS
ncbi:MAG: hypothetical protein IT440_12480 [Phycisphaeraceae bacterium]|nr:hypothetical protein [Phycisphaeraceae bacterium]